MISVDGLNNGQAVKVLAEFKKMVRKWHRAKRNEGYITTQVYANCREQGFHLRAHLTGCGWNARAVSFSECRNSDQITVYRGYQDDFEFNTNIPVESTYYASRYFFPCGDYATAARYIYEWLINAKPTP